MKREQPKNRRRGERTRGAITIIHESVTSDTTNAPCPTKRKSVVRSAVIGVDISAEVGADSYRGRHTRSHGGSGAGVRKGACVCAAFGNACGLRDCDYEETHVNDGGDTRIASYGGLGHQHRAEIDTPLALRQSQHRGMGSLARHPRRRGWPSPASIQRKRLIGVVCWPCSFAVLLLLPYDRAHACCLTQFDDQPRTTDQLRTVSYETSK